MAFFDSEMAVDSFGCSEQPDEWLAMARVPCRNYNQADEPQQSHYGDRPQDAVLFRPHECLVVNMYKRILLAYDGSIEGRTALREGALLAKQCGAQVFLLSVLTETGTLLLSEVTLAVATVQMEEDFQEILKEGIARLKKLGFDPVAELVRGQPAEEIGKFAKKVGADLIVVGHRRQSAFDRWWSGPKGAYLMDYTDCSLLVARNAVSDEAMEKLLTQG